MVDCTLSGADIDSVESFAGKDISMEIFKGLHAFIWRDFQANNCNTYFIEGSKKILVDPGIFQFFSHVRAGLAHLGLSPGQIDVVVITHEHYDHMDSVHLFEKPTWIAMSRGARDSIRKYGNGREVFPEPDFMLTEGTLNIGNASFYIIPSPGHSPGSICVYWPDRKVLFSGDTIFKQSIGRSDLPGGQGSLLKESILRISKLDIEYLLPGHGEIIEGKKEVQENFRFIERQWFRYLEDN
ncbi:MAG: MBL fold metallo-hydrolase [Syntrophales bacterium]